MKCVREIAASGNGFVAWELMIGRDNCRFPWGHPHGLDEPAQLFHGIVHPDGYPWSVEEIRALLGEAAFRSLEQRVFRVEYFRGRFESRKKISITPWIDFDLGNEHGYGSPNASAGIGPDDFSIRWTAEFSVPETGSYTFHGSADGLLQVWTDDRPVLNVEKSGRREGSGGFELVGGRKYRIRADYLHREGNSHVRLRWSGPNLAKQIFQPQHARGVSNGRRPRAAWQGRWLAIPIAW